MKLIISDNRMLSADEAMRVLAYFPAARRAEILQYRRERDRVRSIVAEAAARVEIMQKLGLKNQVIRIVRGESGKPRLDCASGPASVSACAFGSAPSFYFNLSHSGELSVCAADESEVGVDAEMVRPVRYDPIAARCFSAREREELREAPTPLAVFFRIWTEKESILKQRGTGLGGAFGRLSALETAMDGQDALPAYHVQTFALPADMGTLFSFREGEILPQDPSYVLSVCTARRVTAVAEFLSAQALLQKFRELCEARM